MTAPYRFLFDECLSTDLVQVTNAHGFEATHINFRNLRGASDRFLTQLAVDTDLTMVTNNARDYKRNYAHLDLHPGLIVILPSVPMIEQLRLMALVLGRLSMLADATSLLIEIDAAGDITISEWPAP